MKMGPAAFVVQEFGEIDGFFLAAGPFFVCIVEVGFSGVEGAGG